VKQKEKSPKMTFYSAVREYNTTLKLNHLDWFHQS